jgi:hypothetical protein
LKPVEKVGTIRLRRVGRAVVACGESAYACCSLSVSERPKVKVAAGRLMRTGQLMFAVLAVLSEGGRGRPACHAS